MCEVSGGSSASLTKSLGIESSGIISVKSSLTIVGVNLNESLEVAPGVSIAATFSVGVIFHLLSIESFVLRTRLVSERLIQRELIGTGGMISCMGD